MKSPYLDELLTGVAEIRSAVKDYRHSELPSRVATELSANVKAASDLQTLSQELPQRLKLAFMRTWLKTNHESDFAVKRLWKNESTPAAFIELGTALEKYSEALKPMDGVLNKYASIGVTFPNGHSPRSRYNQVMGDVFAVFDDLMLALKSLQTEIDKISMR